MIAQLVAQAEAEGAGLVTLRAITEEASAAGAERALARLGLGDEGAVGDVRELRELLSAWRDAKKSAVRAVIGWVARVAFALVLIGIAFQAGLTGKLGQ
ncbi:DUF6127 family protein [Sphingomonas sp. ID0503]|uniref:DUF6127 family protein n=1 Tax=Sphingomonas sp. ID0503 TaxID=3399691 RepID=UPI003AFA8024